MILILLCFIVSSQAQFSLRLDESTYSNFKLNHDFNPSSMDEFLFECDSCFNAPGLDDYRVFKLDGIRLLESSDINSSIFLLENENNKRLVYLIHDGEWRKKNLLSTETNILFSDQGFGLGSASKSASLICNETLVEVHFWELHNGVCKEKRYSQLLGETWMTKESFDCMSLFYLEEGFVMDSEDLKLIDYYPSVPLELLVPLDEIEGDGYQVIGFTEGSSETDFLAICFKIDLLKENIGSIFIVRFNSKSDLFITEYNSYSDSGAPTHFTLEIEAGHIIKRRK